MTIDRLRPMLHVIADYSESYCTTSFSCFEVKRGSHKEVVGRIVLRWLRGDLTTLRPEAVLYTLSPPRTLTLCDSYFASHDS